ncbi:MAG: hypothetical protein N3B21_02410 [Clostridia bacterium]|nr:hypothetical protein [Clostridia bacterium]
MYRKLLSLLMILSLTLTFSVNCFATSYITESEFNNNFSVADSIRMDSYVTGRATAGDIDYFVFNNGAPDDISFLLCNGYGANFDLRLYNGSKQLIYSASSTSRGNVNEQFSKFLLPGTYYVSVVWMGGTTSIDPAPGVPYSLEVY